MPVAMNLVIVTTGGGNLSLSDEVVGAGFDLARDTAAPARRDRDQRRGVTVS